MIVVKIWITVGSRGILKISEAKLLPSRWSIVVNDDPNVFQITNHYEMLSIQIRYLGLSGTLRV